MFGRLDNTRKDYVSFQSAYENATKIKQEWAQTFQLGKTYTIQKIQRINLGRPTYDSTAWSFYIDDNTTITQEQEKHVSILHFNHRAMQPIPLHLFNICHQCSTSFL